MKSFIHLILIACLSVSPLISQDFGDFFTEKKEPEVKKEMNDNKVENDETTKQLSTNDQESIKDDEFKIEYKNIINIDSIIEKSDEKQKDIGFKINGKIVVQKMLSRGFRPRTSKTFSHELSKQLKAMNIDEVIDTRNVMHYLEKNNKKIFRPGEYKKQIRITRKMSGNYMISGILIQHDFRNYQMQLRVWDLKNKQWLIVRHYKATSFLSFYDEIPGFLKDFISVLKSSNVVDDQNKEKIKNIPVKYIGLYYKYKNNINHRKAAEKKNLDMANYTLYKVNYSRNRKARVFGRIALGTTLGGALVGGLSTALILNSSGFGGVIIGFLGVCIGSAAVIGGAVNGAISIINRFKGRYDVFDLMGKRITLMPAIKPGKYYGAHVSYKF